MTENAPDLEGFKPIPGYNRYLINNVGVVYSTIRRGRFMSDSMNKKGYRYSTLMADGAKKGHKELLHRLVAITFVPNPNDYPIVNHEDGNKLNCNHKNLLWCTYKYNNDHARDNGLVKNFGEHHYRAKLTEEDIRDIRLLASSGVYHKTIAKKYSVCRQHITSIVGTKRWRRVA